MIKYIKKRDGSIQEFEAAKVNKWGEWASKTLGSYVDWSSIVLHTVSTCPETCSSELLQERLIKTCLDQDSWSYNRMAGRLYAALLNKRFYGDNRPTVHELHEKLQELGLMKHLNYSDEEYIEVEKMINHNRDFKAAHFELEQVRKKYALKNRVTGDEYETQQFVYMRMAMALSEDQPKDRRLQDVKSWYEHFSNKRINAPTPNYINLGTPFNGLASCCIYKAGDSASSLAIGDHIAYTMTYMSAGIGSYLESRSLGDPVRNGAIKHQGKLPYYRALDGAVHANLQAGRGGACTTYFSAFDPEVVDITKLKNPMTTKDKQIRGLDYAMMQNKFFAKKVAKNEDIFLFNVYSAPDLTKAMFSGDIEEFERIYNEYAENDSLKKTWVNAREVLLSQLNESYETGKAYLLWADEMNRHTPHKDAIHTSNLCVAPETLVLTEFGHKPIAEMEGESVKVWNGEEFSEVDIVKTGENQKLLRVTTNSGYELECTPYHKWYVFDGYGKPYKEVRTVDLKPGSKLAKFDLPVVEGSRNLGRAYENGFFTGDGTVSQNTQVIYLHGEKKDLMGNFSGVDWNFNGYGADMIVGRTRGLEDKFFVPLDDYTLESRLEWLAGFLDADGCVYRNGTNEQLTATSINKTFLREVQMLLQTMGVASKITKAGEEGVRMLPLNDGSGETGEFFCQEIERLLITSCDAQRLLELGLNLRRLRIEKRTPQRDARRFIQVEEVIDEGRFDDTYCFTEPKRHMGVFNGILTGQCTETGLPTKEYQSMSDLYSENPERVGEVAMCSLGAINVSNIKDDEQYADAAYYTLLMIDKCIHKADYPLPHVGVTAKSRLNAGVGIMGLAHYLAKNKVKYSSPEGKRLINEVGERHAYHVISASLKLSKELGVAPWMNRTKWPEGWLPIDTYNRNVDSVAPSELKYDWEGLRQAIIKNGGIRNSSLINHMPGESSSKASGTTNGVYPIRELTILKTDLNNVVYWAAPDGERLEKWYESAWDIKTKDLVDCYAILQKWTDQAISADFYRKIIGSDAVTTKEMLTDYLYMTKMGMKTRYYVNSYTSANGRAQTNVDDEGECESCKL